MPGEVGLSRLGLTGHGSFSLSGERPSPARPSLPALQHPTPAGSLEQPSSVGLKSGDEERGGGRGAEGRRRVWRGKGGRKGGELQMAGHLATREWADSRTHQSIP